MSDELDMKFEATPIGERIEEDPTKAWKEDMLAW